MQSVITFACWEQTLTHLPQPMQRSSMISAQFSLTFIALTGQFRTQE
jgi:hypothetical protein